MEALTIPELMDHSPSSIQLTLDDPFLHFEGSLKKFQITLYFCLLRVLCTSHMYLRPLHLREYRWNTRANGAGQVLFYCSLQCGDYNIGASAPLRFSVVVV